MTDKNAWVFTTQEAFDITAPIVEIYSPAPSGKLEPLGASLSIKFNEKVFAGSGTIAINNWNGTSFGLLCSIPINSGAVSIDTAATGRTVTIAPRTGSACPSFVHDGRYQVVIGADAFRDLTGNYFAGENTWEFIAKADTTPPIVASYSPARAQSNVSVGTANFSMTFNEPIKRVGSPTVKATIFPVNSPGSKLSMDIMGDPADPNKIKLTLATGPLLANTRYSINVPAGVIEDMFGNPFGGIWDASVWIFDTAGAGNTPVLNKAEMDGSSVVLSYSETLDSSKIPSGTNFIVTVNTVNNPVTAVSVSGSQVRLSLLNAVLVGQIVKVSYMPDSNKAKHIQTPSLKDAASFSNREVTNTGDTTFAKPVSGSASDSTVVLEFNKALDSPGTNAHNQFRVVWGSRVLIPTSILIEGSTVVLTIPSVSATEGTIYVSYTPSIAPLKDSAGLTVLAFQSFYVMNPNDTTVPQLTDATALGNKLVLKYNEALNGSVVPSLSSFSVLANGSAVSIASIAINGNSVELTLDKSLTSNQTLTLYYSPSYGSPIMDLRGNPADAINGRQMTGTVLQPAKLSYATVKGKALELGYSANLSAAAMPTVSQYSVKADNVSVPVASVNVSGTKVSLTLSTAIRYGQNVRLTYTATSTALKDGANVPVEAIADYQVNNASGLLDELSDYFQIDAARGLSVVPGGVAKQPVAISSGRTGNKYMLDADKLDAALSIMKTTMGSVITIPQITIPVPAGESAAVVSCQSSRS